MLFDIVIWLLEVRLRFMNLLSQLLIIIKVGFLFVWMACVMV
jgi:hypothetical protein